MFPIWSILEPETQVVLVLEAAYIIYIHTYMNRFMYTKLYICIYIYIYICICTHISYYILHTICNMFILYYVLNYGISPFPSHLKLVDESLRTPACRLQRGEPRASEVSSPLL